MSDPLELLAFAGDDPDALGVGFQQSIMPRLDRMTDTELFTLAGALLGCGGKTEATYVADLAFRRACGEQHEPEPKPARQPEDSSNRTPGQRSRRRAAAGAATATGALERPAADTDAPVPG
jgi:hypothetical protein